MAPKGRGLGKGLDALIPSAQTPKKAKEGAAEVSEEKGKEQLVKITKVEPNREQPRKNFDEDSLLELAESIKQFGLLQPIWYRTGRIIMKLLPAREDGVRQKLQD